MIQKLPGGAYYIEDNKRGTVRYDEGVIDLLYVENKHIKLARLLEPHTFPIVLDFIFSLDDFEDYTFEEKELSGMNKKDIIYNIFYNYIDIEEIENENLY
jgi:hypothetical protein